MFKVLMNLIGIGKRPAVNTPESKPEEPEKELGLPKELLDEIERWRYIQGYANSLRAHMGER